MGKKAKEPLRLNLGQRVPYKKNVYSHVFPFKENQRYPTKNIFKSRNVHSVNYGTESLSHLGPKNWSLLPDHIK